MRKQEFSAIDRFFKKEALRKGVTVKEVNMPIKNFARLFKQRVAPFLSLESIFQIVEEATNSCDSVYITSDGTKHVIVKDSNMPGLVDNKFDLLNASLLNEISKTTYLNEVQQSHAIHNLCVFIEDLAKPSVR